MSKKQLIQQMDDNILQAINQVLAGYRDDYIYIDIAGSNGHYKVVPSVERLEELRVKVKGMYNGRPSRRTSVRARPPKVVIREFVRDGEAENAYQYAVLTGEL